MTEFSPQRRPDEPAKKRVRPMWTGTVFRMELCPQEPGMIFQLDDFDQPAVGREAA
jgi:hypothetical protein